MRIGRLAAQADVNVQTVRYYERRGLLPEPERTRSGYREYGRDDLLRLRFIRRAKDLGFTLTEVKELLDLRVGPRATADDVRLRAQAKLATTRARIDALQQIEAALSRLVASCDAHGSPDQCALIHAIEAQDDNRRED
ncbi:MAG TPA: heavy metal-responsive transcriptional regulator [Longimicrobiales bacterium]|nr:heavy metal-responsive transcriptional regulator [Longimicrobiales bacterium]